VQLFQGEGAQNTVSRRHAQLRLEGGNVKLEDLVRRVSRWFRFDWADGLGGGG
jgi:pSer/pThr/pTyr-binding forkhead associated (FHA) protein